MRAVHFGAGNIGRGFIGAVLQDAGYFVTFADVNDSIVELLNKSTGYDVIELGESPKVTHYSQYRALNSIQDEKELVRAIEAADVVTASVGATILPRIAPTISKALQLRDRSKPIVIMACENAVNATDILKDELVKLGSIDGAIFANTAVDRIVPIQSAEIAPSVEVESFCEWVIETQNLVDVDLHIPAATMVPELEPFIERKLYTVNTAHCAVAYLGQKAGFKTIAAALQNKQIRNSTELVLEETSKFLKAKFGFDSDAHKAYVAKTLKRLSDPIMDDEVARVGRQPLRKLSRSERLVGPAAGLAELGETPTALLEVIRAALGFVSSEDEEAILMHQKLANLSPDEFATQVCEIESGHPLFAKLVAVIKQEKAAA